jgi:putative flavoprotein involved in K+ transport
LDDLTIGGAKAEDEKHPLSETAQPVDTVVIGGGQAGLSVSYYLTEQGREHVVLEKDRPAESWRSKKWDSFTLVTPNRQLQLPGFAYQGDDPHGFLTRDQVVQYLDDFVAMSDPPLRLGVEATSVEGKPTGNGFRVETDTGILEASNVVVATGTFQRPRIPAFGQQSSPAVAQMHSSRYRNPERLRPGAVLVVGSGQSGCQITEELYQSGRKVYLCTSSVGRAPRRYRGKDFTWWLDNMGFVDRTVDQLDSPTERFDPNPHVTGKDGGHTLNLHQFALDGVTLLGRMEGAEGSQVRMADNLMENLKAADKAATQMKKGIDKFIEKADIDAPEEEGQKLRAGYDTEVITELDLESTGVETIIWATGYAYDFKSLVKFPIWDEFGYPVQERGVTKEPGLYFLGLHWLHTLKSGLFAGIADDAAHVAAHIDSRS